MFQHPRERGEIFAHAQFTSSASMIRDLQEDFCQFQRVRKERFEVARVECDDVVKDLLAASTTRRYRRFRDSDSVPNGLLAVRFENLAYNS